MVIDGLTVASQNMGVIKTIDNEVICTYSLRGAIESYNDEGMEILVNFCNIFGFEWESGSRYPCLLYTSGKILEATRDNGCPITSPIGSIPVATIAINA